VSASLPAPFPDIDISKDYNPGIRLFANVLSASKTIVEYLVEFLALVFSEKWVDSESIRTPLPSTEVLHNWPQEKSSITYHP